MLKDAQRCSTMLKDSGDAMVIDFGVKIELWRCEIALRS
jgi:hypothetical protein